MSREVTKLHESKLYHYMVERLPSEFLKTECDDPKDGRINMLNLSKELGFSQYTVWRWMNGIHLGKKAIHALTKLSNETDEVDKKGLIKVEDLTPFMFNS